MSMLSGIRSLVQAAQEELKEASVTLLTRGPSEGSPGTQRPQGFIENQTGIGTLVAMDPKVANVVFTSGATTKVPGFSVTIPTSLWRNSTNQALPLDIQFWLRIDGVVYDPVARPKEHTSDYLKIFCVKR